MNRPYFAWRNHSRRFSLAGSGAALTGCATEVGEAALKGCAPEVNAPTVSASATPIRGRMSTSESDARRQLNHTRRPRRIRNADCGAEIRVDLTAVHVEPCRAVDVLEFYLVEQVVDLGAELQRARPGDYDVLEDCEVGVDDSRLPDDVARRIAVAAAGRPCERRRVEEAGQRITAAGERITGEDRTHEVQTRLAAGEAGTVAALTAGEVEAVGGRERDIGPVARDEVILARHLPAVEQHLHRSAVPAGQIPGVVDHQAVAVALNELGIEEGLRAIERVRQVARIFVGDATRPLQRVGDAELHAADVAAIHLYLQRLIVAFGEVAADAN